MEITLNKKNKVKSSLSWRITSCIVVVIFSIYAAIYLYMLFWLIMSCLKTHSEIVMNPFSLPKKLQWSNFIDMFQAFSYNDTTLWGMIWNSIWHSVGSTIIHVWCAASVAYLSQKYKFPGAKMIAPFVVFTLVFPIYGSSGATYRLVYTFGFANNYTILITAGTILTWNFLYFQAFFTNLSWSYAEAAFIDGANDWDVYYQIMLPQAVGIIGAIGITFWSTSWADYSSQILYLTEMPTLSVGIYYFQLEMVQRARMDVLYCACFISLLPVFTLYVLFNNVLFKNISLGGIKM